MVRRTHLEHLVKDIAALTNSATSEDEAKQKGLERYLCLEYNSVYGGYRLVSVSVKTGGHAGCFGMSSIEPRLRAKDMYSKLTGIIAGLEYTQK